MSGLNKWCVDLLDTSKSRTAKTDKTTGNEVMAVLSVQDIGIFEIIDEDTLAELKAAAGSDWPLIKDNPEKLRWWAGIVSESKIKRLGKVPKKYTYTSVCRYCGPIWTFHPDRGLLDICPWCTNRQKGLPIPKPPLKHEPALEE